MHPTVRNRLPSLSPVELYLGGLVVAAELFAVGVYLGPAGGEVRTVRYALYPFLWINVGLWVVYRTDPRAASRRTRWVAGAVAAAYFLVLANLTGLIAVETAPLSLQAAGLVPHLPVAHAGGELSGLQVTMGTPGWGPRVAYVGEGFHAYFVPFRVIGYLSLSYLVYAAVLEAAGAALPGLVGLASCVGCSFPLAAGPVAGLTGGAVAVGAAAAGLEVDLSTAAFLAAVALLYWRPGFGGATTR